MSLTLKRCQQIQEDIRFLERLLKEWDPAAGFKAVIVSPRNVSRGMEFSDLDPILINAMLASRRAALTWMEALLKTELNNILHYMRDDQMPTITTSSDK